MWEPLAGVMKLFCKADLAGFLPLAVSGVLRVALPPLSPQKGTAKLVSGDGQDVLASKLPA